MLLGAMPEESGPRALLVPTAKSQRATDFSIAAIMAGNGSPPLNGDDVAARDSQNDCK